MRQELPQTSAEMKSQIKTDIVINSNSLPVRNKRRDFFY